MIDFYGNDQMTEQFQATMQTVRVSRTALLFKLKENREKHIKDYKEAVKGYNESLTKILSDKLKDVKKNPDKYKGGLYLHEQPPQNYTSAYDNVIAMMEIGIDDDVVMTSKEIQQYICDNWEWKQVFAASVAKYSNK